MANPIIQTSFNSGEWAPNLYGRVDLQKYHSGATLLKNFFVDYRGGVTTRPGTRYIGTCKSNETVRLLPFQASFSVTYILEFGQGYIRFINNGAYVVESGTSISAQTPGSPVVFTDTAHGYAIGDWLLIGGNYYIVLGTAPNTFTLTDLFGNPINTNPFTLPIPAQRVYTLLNSPYQASDVFGIKYAQNVNTLILCHPNYAPYQLVLHTATNWTLSAINFGSTISAPTGVSTSVSTGGALFIDYVVTANDVNNQESQISGIAGANPASGATITISWAPVAGATSYNIYRTIVSDSAIPNGQQFGFIGNVTGTSFVDGQNIVVDFSQGPPIVENPFQGTGVSSLALTAGGSGYTSAPAVVFTGGSPTTPASASCDLTAKTFVLTHSGVYAAFIVGELLSCGFGITVQVTGMIPFGTGFAITSVLLVSGGEFSAMPIGDLFFSGEGGFVYSHGGIQITGCAVNKLFLASHGAGYLSAPGVGFSGGGGIGAAATATIGSSGSAGNPTVPGIVQQRLFLGGMTLSPGQFNMSQPGAYYNFNTTFPVAPDDAIQATLTNTTLNSIKSVVPVSAGLVIFADKGAWLLNGGSAGAPISATSLSANPQSYSGASDLPPIVTPNDLLYVQAKNSIVRDLSYNFYINNYVGNDISVLSSHLFYGFSMVQWAWAEEPFKIAWLVRSDGQMLSLTFVKEQELMAWTHHITNGTYVSVVSVNEPTAIGNVDATYVVVKRNINGQSVNYVERMVELYYPNDFQSSWQVDAGIGYNASPATTFSGAQHLGGQPVTGVADGVVINFTMPTSGTFVFGPGGTPGLTAIADASIVTVGLAFDAQLIPLPLDLGEPTVQSKRKKITGVTVRITNTLGLQIGRQSDTTVGMKDLVVGNVGTMTNRLVTGLVNGDARTVIDPLWDVYGQYFIQQAKPYPATILAVIPEIMGGDKDK